MNRACRNVSCITRRSCFVKLACSALVPQPEFQPYSCVIPKARVFSSGPRDLPRNCGLLGDPSLRLKNGYAQDDPSQDELQTEALPARQQRLLREVVAEVGACPSCDRWSLRRQSSARILLRNFKDRCHKLESQHRSHLSQRRSPAMQPRQPHSPVAPTWRHRRPASPCDLRVYPSCRARSRWQ